MLSHSFYECYEYESRVFRFEELENPKALPFVDTRFPPDVCFGDSHEMADGD